MKTKFVYMVEVGFTNIESKTKTIIVLSDYLTLIRSSLGVSTLILLYITVVEVLAVFINADTRIKRVQIGDHETKQILPMTPPLFLRDISCLTRMQAILKL